MFRYPDVLTSESGDGSLGMLIVMVFDGEEPGSASYTNSYYRLVSLNRTRHKCIDVYFDRTNKC